MLKISLGDSADWYPGRADVGIVDPTPGAPFSVIHRRWGSPGCLEEGRGGRREGATMATDIAPYQDLGSWLLNVLQDHQHCCNEG
jgi:hypothetical protein